MPLSAMAERLLHIHAKEPRRLFYGTVALGSAFRDGDIHRLDEAYRELEGFQLVEPSEVTVSFFGNPKRLYRLTEKGTQLIKEPAA